MKKRVVNCVYAKTVLESAVSVVGYTPLLSKLRIIREQEKYYSGSFWGILNISRQQEKEYSCMRVWDWIFGLGFCKFGTWVCGCVCVCVLVKSEVGKALKHACY